MVKKKAKANGRSERISPSEGRRLLDRQARRLLGMTGTAFMRRWDRRQIKDPDRPEVMRVAILLPLAR
jgi:hypothetical protein